MGLFKLLLFSVCISSCSSVQFHSKSKDQITFSAKKDYVKDFKKVVSKDFFLLGAIPSQHKIDVAKEIKSSGLDSLAQLKIEDVTGIKEAFFTFISFGFYMPKKYQISGKAYFVTN